MSINLLVVMQSKQPTVVHESTKNGVLFVNSLKQNVHRTHFKLSKNDDVTDGFELAILLFFLMIIDWCLFYCSFPPDNYFKIT